MNKFQTLYYDCMKLRCLIRNSYPHKYLFKLSFNPKYDCRQPRRQPYRLQTPKGMFKVVPPEHKNDKI